MLRRVGQLPLIRRFVRTRFGPLVAALRCTRVVGDRAAYLSKELCFRRLLGRHRISKSGLTFYLRHNTPDIWTLTEVFLERQYELPDPVVDLIDSLSRPPVVADLGANIGLFGLFVLGRYPDARITGFEPDRANAAVHSLCIRANSRSDRWRLVEACAYTHDGALRFMAGDFAESRVEAHGRADTVELPAVDIFPYLDDVDLLKLDIEGAEWPILADSRFARIAAKAIVLEYHPHLCPDRYPRAAALARLQAAGYETFEPARDQRRDHGILWGWRGRV